MITAIVLYRLPASIGRDACAAHFASISQDFRSVPGLLRKQFIWNETGMAGGVYLWETIEAAKAFYSGPWLDGIIARYGAYPDISYFRTTAMTDNAAGTIDVFETGEV